MKCHCTKDADPNDYPGGAIACTCGEEETITDFGEQGIKVYVPERRMRGIDMQAACDELTEKLNKHFDSDKTIYVDSYEGECLKIKYSHKSSLPFTLSDEIELELGKILTHIQMAKSLFSYGAQLARMI